MRAEVVVGRTWKSPPILRMSCSSFRLWMIDPEHMNSMALKKAWVQMCMKARCGWLIPMVTIIRPSWLEVEKATIFLMSFWVRAQMAVNRVVMAPRHRVVVWIVLLFSIRGWNRISRNTPATTIVLEWSRADTGVGPSMAEGSHGCSPNCADFPVAASSRPARGMFVFSGFSMRICWRSHEFRFVRNHAIDRISPMSPMRLYRMACMAAVFASVRPCHQPIRRKDMIPTPSQPMKSWNMLLADTRIIIVIRKISRYLKNRLMWGSDFIYHRENSMIDHVTNRATGMNVVEK